MNESLENFWPKSIEHLSNPYIEELDEEVTIAEISSEPINNYPGYRHIYTALIPLDEVNEVLRKLGSIGHKVEAHGPNPGSGKKGVFDSSFWISSLDKENKRYETLINSWQHHNNTVLLPDNGLLMCYGLIPRYLKDGIVCWDNPRKPEYDVIRVKFLSKYKGPDEHTHAIIIIKRDYLEDYLSLKGCAAVAVFYEHRYSSNDSDIDKILGDEKGIELNLPGRKLVLKRVTRRFFKGTQLTQIWGCRLILRPEKLPISEEKEPILLWPDIKKPVTPDEVRELSYPLDEAFVKDDVLKLFEGKDEFIILPEHGIVSYGGWWATSYSIRYGRHHICVELRKLYEGTPSHIIRHFHLFSIPETLAKKEKKIYGERHIGHRAKEAIYGYLQLIESLSTIAEKVGLFFKEEEIGGFSKADVDYKGWCMINAFKPLCHVISLNMKKEEFLNRCFELFKLLENIKPYPIRHILTNLGIPKTVIGNLKSLRLLGTLCQLAKIALDNGFDLINDIENIIPLWDEKKKLIELSPIFALNCLRNLVGHRGGKEYHIKLDGALEVFGIDREDTKKGWGQALDIVYDKLIESSQSIEQIINGSYS